MILYLARHGEAMGSSMTTEASLSLVGRENTMEIADFLAPRINPKMIIYSQKLRARQTAEIFAQALPSPPFLEEKTNLNPNDSIEPLLAELMQWKTSVMVVGHLPFLAKLIPSLLTGKEAYLPLQLDTSSVVCLENEGTFWKLLWMISPLLLGPSRHLK